MYIYSFLNLGIVVQSIVIVGTLIFFCPLIFTKSEVCDYRSGAQRGYFGFLLMDLCELVDLNLYWDHFYPLSPWWRRVGYLSISNHVNLRGGKVLVFFVKIE